MKLALGLILAAGLVLARDVEDERILAEIAARANEPADFPAGISVPDTNGVYFVAVPVAAGAPPIMVYDHASPRDGLFSQRVARAVGDYTNVQWRLFMAIRISSNLVREAGQRIAIIRQTVNTNGVANAGDRARWLAVQSNLVELAGWCRDSERNQWRMGGAVYDLTWGTNAPSRKEVEP